jgi:hypothetical protein
MAGLVILLGHYIDFFNMIIPGTVGDRWFLMEYQEVASVLFSLGLFIFVVLPLAKVCTAKESLTSKRRYNCIILIDD